MTNIMRFGTSNQSIWFEKLIKNWTSQISNQSDLDLGIEVWESSATINGSMSDNISVTAIITTERIKAYCDKLINGSMEYHWNNNTINRILNHIFNLD